MPTIREVERRDQFLESLKPWQRQLLQEIDTILRDTIQRQAGDVPYEIEPGAGEEPLGLVMQWVQPDKYNRTLSVRLTENSIEEQPVLQTWISLWKDSVKEPVRWWWSSDVIEIRSKTEDLAGRFNVLVGELVGEKHIGDLEKTPLSH